MKLACKKCKWFDTNFLAEFIEYTDPGEESITDFLLWFLIKDFYAYPNYRVFKKI